MKRKCLMGLLTLALGGALSAFVSTAKALETDGDEGNSTPALAQALNADGSLKAGLDSSFDPKGFRLKCSANGAPRFVPVDQTASTDALTTTCGDRWDDRFVNDGLDALVGKVLVSGSDVYVTGGFTTAGGTIAKQIAKWDGTSWTALGNGFSGGDGFNGGIGDMALSGGTLYASGSFTALCDDADCSATTPGYNHVARWNGSSWSPVGYGFSGSVYSLVASGSTLYAGGYALRICNDAACATTAPSHNGVAQWNGSSWSLLGNGFSDGGAFALAVSGGTLYAGGSFTALCNDAACSTSTMGYNRVAQWNGFLWTPLGHGLNNAVRTLAVSGGTVYAGGDFTVGCADATCSATVSGYNHVAQWNGALWTTLGNGVNHQVFALAVSGGTLYASGNFTGLCANAACAASMAGYRHVAQWKGAAWSTLGYGLEGGDGRGVYGLGVSGDTLYAGGSIAYTCNDTACSSRTGGYSNIAQWNGTSWSSVGDANKSVDEPVAVLAVSGSDVYVGGTFKKAGGTIVNGIAKWDGTHWTALGNGFNDGIFALLVSGGTLYAGGDFTALCKDAACSTTTPGYNNVARWNGSSWSPVGNGFRGDVRALAVSGGMLYAGGYFSRRCDDADCTTTTAGYNSVAQWDGSSWSPLGNGFYGFVFALAASRNTLYAGGRLDAICNDADCSATTLGYNHVAQWNGTAWSALGYGLNSDVAALTISSSTLYVGGYFDGLCNDALCITKTPGYNHIAKWNGAAWAPLGGGFNSSVGALSVSKGTLYAGGYFIAACADAACGTMTAGYNRIAQWNGTSWSPLDNGVNGGVSALAVSSDNLYAGGSFSTAGCRASRYFARYSLPKRK